MQTIRELYKSGRGPSSSHTMGPARAAKLFSSRYPEADRFSVTLYGSLSKTGRGHGTDRVLMASDSPWTNQGRSIAYIREMGLSTEETDKILGGNARRLLGL